MANFKRIGISLPSELFSESKNYAQNNDFSFSGLVKRALRKEIKKVENGV